MILKMQKYSRFIIGDLSHTRNIVYDDDFCKYLKLQCDAEENDDFKNAKIFKYVCMCVGIHTQRERERERERERVSE